MKPWTLKNKKAVITGGTKGIGFSTATEFLSLGAAVFIVARNEEEVNSTVSNWQKEGFEAYGVAADISTDEGRIKLLETAKEKWGWQWPAGASSKRIDGGWLKLLGELDAIAKDGFVWHG